MALGGGLLVSSSNLNGTLVNLDPREDIVLLEDINEGLASLGALVQGLLKEDHTADVLEGTRGAEEELTESTAVVLDVLNVDAGKALANGAGGLVSSEDTLARGANVGSVLDELILVLAAVGRHGRCLGGRFESCKGRFGVGRRGGFFSQLT